jgi:hypothetical protein
LKIPSVVDSTTATEDQARARCEVCGAILSSDRSIAIDRLRSLITRIGYGRRTYNTGQLLDEDIEYEDELDLSVMDQMSLAGTRFKWMLSRLRSS